MLAIVAVGAESLRAAYPGVRNIPRSVYGAGAQNWDFTQTAGGCIYIANNVGLLEYDGNRWDHYYMPNGTTVRSLLYAGDEERIYAGAYDEFGYFEPGSDGRLKYTSMKPSFEGENTMTEFWNIHRIGSTLYFRTDWGIFRYFGEGKTDIMHFPGNRIDCSAVIYNSLLVSTGKDGPMILSGDMFVPLPGAGRLAGKNVCSMLPFGDGRILFATDIHGLWLYDGSDIVKYATRFDDRLREDQLWCADIRGTTLALGTIRGGVYAIDISDGSGFRFDRPAGLQNNTVLSLFFDIDSNLWLGLDNGLAYLMLDLPDQSVFSQGEGIGAGYSSLIYNGNIYLGTNQGLFHAKYRPGITDFGEFKAIASGDGAVAQVWRLNEIGGTLFCSHDRGLLIMQGGSITNITEMLGVWKVIPLRGHDDMILGCSYQGLFVLKKERSGVWRLSHRIDGWDESSGMFVEDANGHIWFSHWRKGLFRLTLDSEKRRVTEAEYFGVGKGFPTEHNNAPYEVGSEMVFSSEGGFYLYDKAQNRMVREHKLNDLFNNRSPVAMRIHDLGQGDLLFVSAAFCGLAVGGDNGGYTLDSLSIRHIADELIAGFDNHTMLNDSMLLMSNQNGFSLVDLTRIKNSRAVRSEHPVFVKAMWCTGRGETLVHGERGGDGGSRHELPKIPYRDNSLRIVAAMPEYRDPSAIEYSFMLKGYDKEWSSFSTDASKEYTFLKEGRYTLMIRARNNFTQSISETKLEFLISPPWYRSYVAMIFYFLCLLVAVWFAIRMIDRRSNRRVNDMKRQKEHEMREQQHLYEETVKEKEKELVVLQNQALKQDLMGKSQELASSTMNIIRKNEILMQIEDSIGKAIPCVTTGDPSRAASMLRRVLRDIRENIEHDSDWEKFEHNFDMVHENYLKRLSEGFPGLNLNDKRLCAYLRMDLQSKDIAPLMNISVRSVEMARYRLRKKMGLGREVNLSEYLQNF